MGHGRQKRITGPPPPTLFDDLPESAIIHPPPDLALTVDEAIRLAIDLELRSGPKTAIHLVESLTQSGIGVKASQTGFRFFLAGRSYKGSELGEDYTLAGLAARGMEYDPADLAALKAISSRPIEPYKPPLAEIMTWPDRILPGPGAIQTPLSSGPDKESVSTRKNFRERFRSFVDSENLLFWKIKDSSIMEFYHRRLGPKRERAGLAFIDRGDSLDIRIALDHNILVALRFGIFKWGTIALAGSPIFIARAEALAKEEGLKLMSTYSLI